MTVKKRQLAAVTLACSIIAMLSMITAGTASAVTSAATGGTASTSPPDPLPARPLPSSAAPYAGPAGSPDPWAALAHPAPMLSPGPMELEPNGTVLVNNACTREWWKLTPDAHGSYVGGTWSKLAEMPKGYSPLYFGSAILPTGAGVPAGSMIVEGGEYNGNECNPVWTNKGALYNPDTNTWKPIAPPDGWTTIGDAQSNVLTNGQYMQANCCTKQDALFNPSTLTWTPTGTEGKVGINDEEGWSLLPSGKLLTVDVWEKTDAGLSDTQLYDPGTGAWTSIGYAPTKLTTDAYELGPQVIEPSGQVFTIGAQGSTAIFDDATSTWTTGPNLPVLGGKQYDEADGPASVLPDGRILLAASPGFSLPPMHFWTFDPSTNAFTQVADTVDSPHFPSYVAHFLVLPNGQVLYSDFNHMFVWTDTGTPNPAWAPTIGSVPTSLTAGNTYTLSGTQLAGRSQGAAYGDDFQDNTNYPLVRITNDATGVVTYAPTSGETSLSIAPGVPSSTNFTLPAGTPTGASTLEVVGDGIASQPVSVSVS